MGHFFAKIQKKSNYQKTIRMEIESRPLTYPPRHGYIAKLATLCKCSRKTVTRALFQGQQGKKSDLVRDTYQQLFSGSPENK
jgi:hypothetical protein